MVEPVRLLQCTNCAHKVRFGASHCGYCGAGTPLLNRSALWYGTAVGLALLVLAAV